MSERTIKWWHVVAWMATALMIGLNIGYRQMKRWQDGWYAAHPVVKEVEVPAKFPLLIDGEKRICHYVDETHFICEPPAPAPKPSKGKRKPRTIEQLNAMPGPKMCEMSQPGATLYWPARANGECHREDWGDGSWKPQPEVKPAPLPVMPAALGELLEEAQPIHQGPRWKVKLAPCESMIYEYWDGVMSCEPAVQP